MGNIKKEATYVQIGKISSDYAKDLENMSKDDLIRHILRSESDKGIKIPLTIFQNKNLSSLELVSRFLKEKIKMSNKDISHVLGRSSQNIWLTLHNSRIKQKKKLVFDDTEFYFPATIIDSELSALESVVLYIRQTYGLGFTEISKIICRDPKTVWTANSRAEKKIKQCKQKKR